MYRKKMPNVEAFAITADRQQWPAWARTAWDADTIRPFPGLIGERGDVFHVTGADLRTRANVGDWIVKGDDDLLLVVAPAEFSAEYEDVT